MCGIHAVVSKSSEQPLVPDFERFLCNRGPDHLGRVTTKLRHDAHSLFVTLTSTVLSLRGDDVTTQPLKDEGSGSILCWNGEAWKIDGVPVQGNDGLAVLQRLSSASKLGEEALLEAIRNIDGPFAFVYLDKELNNLYYGRDRLGRRSLLVNRTDSIQLSSIADQGSDGWVEVEADGFYIISLEPSKFEAGSDHTRIDWTSNDESISGIGIFNSEVASESTQLDNSSSSVQQLENHVIQSLRLRALNIPVPPKASDADARIAVLFSGGLDCTVLARMLSDIIPPSQSVDLLNVAFENPRVASHNRDLDQDALYELCPDRITGRKSFEELSAVCKSRLWRFVTINVPYSETTEHRKSVVDLIHPHNTEMDLSIAYALYFAARGQGLAQTSVESQPTPYSTTARVLISGLGADELFGGYLRHGTAFQRLGFPGLIDELKLDVSRLGKRNLGRDDRVMANWGREVRFPYLDEDLVKWAVQLPVWDKCDFNNPGDVGTVEPAKRVLRLLAQNLGLPAVAMEKKRAIQFGARTAKMESGKVKGTTLIS